MSAKINSVYWNDANTLCIIFDTLLDETSIPYYKSFSLCSPNDSYPVSDYIQNINILGDTVYLTIEGEFADKLRRDNSNITIHYNSLSNNQLKDINKNSIDSFYNKYNYDGKIAVSDIYISKNILISNYGIIAPHDSPI